MSTSLTSSEARLRSVELVQGAAHPAELVGRTPFLRLQRSGDGYVWIKREGRSLTGSFFDRVAQHQLASTRGELIVTGWTQHAVAVLALSRTARRVVHHLVTRDDNVRLRALCSTYGVPAVRLDSEESVAAEVARLQTQGATLLVETDRQAHRASWMDVAREVQLSTSTFPPTWVISDLGVGVELVSSAITEAIGRKVRLVTVPWDHAEERTLDGPAACRRQQVGQREGLLCSPLGAELIEAGVNAALHRQHEVCVVLPEDGHRYLGWW